MKYFLMVITAGFLVTAGCTDTHMMEDTITPVEVRFSINHQGSEVYHVYFKHTGETHLSKGKIYDRTDDCLELFPGVYTLYVYGIVAKTASSKKINAYLVLHDIQLFESGAFVLKPDLLLPDVFYTRTDGIIRLCVSMTGLYEMFYISSLSVKCLFAHVSRVR